MSRNTKSAAIMAFAITIAVSAIYLTGVSHARAQMQREIAQLKLAIAQYQEQTK